MVPFAAVFVYTCCDGSKEFQELYYYTATTNIPTCQDGKQHCCPSCSPPLSLVSICWSLLVVDALDIRFSSTLLCEENIGTGINNSKTLGKRVHLITEPWEG